MLPSKEGLVLIMTKYAGLEGTCLLVRENRNGLLNRFPTSFLDQILKLEETLKDDRDRRIAGSFETVPVFEAGEKGIFAALWDFSAELELGLEADLRRIPIRQESIEISNYLDVNPYEISSNGVVLVAAKSSVAGDLLREFDRSQINADVIGSFNKGNDRVLLNRGARRFLTPVKRIEDEIKLRNSQKRTGKVADQPW